jgi:hypothetical protein
MPKVHPSPIRRSADRDDSTARALAPVRGGSQRVPVSQCKCETLSPVQLQGAGHVGIASALLATGKSPFTVLRFPAFGEELADKTAAGMAGRRGSPGRFARPVSPWSHHPRQTLNPAPRRWIAA